MSLLDRKAYYKRCLNFNELKMAEVALRATDKERFDLFKIVAKEALNAAYHDGVFQKEDVKRDYRSLCNIWEEILKEEVKR